MFAKRYHWRHFFGGLALLLLAIQLASGLVLTMFYAPHLNEAYASVQRMYNELAAVAWVRDSHRWAALVLAVAIVLHLVRSLLRKDFLNRDRQTYWLTGSLLLLPLLGFLVTGMILPWEWRAYWFVSMIPNYVGEIPLVGPWLAAFLLDIFTMNRAFVTHVLILPAITLVLIDIHALLRIKNRGGGLSLYLVERGVLALPFLLVIGILAWALPMPSQDPATIPMPLDGEGIPMPEWFVLIFYVPRLYFHGWGSTLVGFALPLALFLVLTLLPYVLKPRSRAMRQALGGDTYGKRIAAMPWLASLRSALGAGRLTKVLGALGVTVAALALFVPFYAVSRTSPTMGCNSCHNLSAGRRMGVPPESFKDRVVNPNLSDYTFMVEHWFYPQVVW
jgi:quinol-cytochrome oxidoreductase complex cytochrome b subunit